MTLSALMQKGGLAMFATTTVATHKTAQQITVAEVAGVAVANVLKPLISTPKHVVVSHLKPEVETAIRDWLGFIEKTDLEIIAHVLNQWRSENEAKDYFIRRSREVPQQSIFDIDKRLCNQYVDLTRNGQCLAARQDVIVDTQPERPSTKVLHMLEGKRFAVLVEDGNTDPVIVTVGIQDLATFELTIPQHLYNGMAVFELIENLSGENYASS